MGCPGITRSWAQPPTSTFGTAPFEGEQYPYRSSGIPHEIARDYLRQRFLDWGATDYQLAWFGAGDWANYTRIFPTNRFFIYARSAGFGPYSMELAEVISGPGTPNQTTRSLGHWNAVGRDNQTHAWVPLVEPGSADPAQVSLGDQATLRLATGTGNCHPSYFMLVPAPLEVLLSVNIVDDPWCDSPSPPSRAELPNTAPGPRWPPEIGCRSNRWRGTDR